MKYKKIICMFFVAILLASASGAIVQARDNKINVKNIFKNDNIVERKVGTVQMISPSEKPLIKVKGDGIKLMGFLDFNEITSINDLGLEKYKDQDVEFTVDNSGLSIFQKVKNIINNIRGQPALVNIVDIKSLEKEDSSNEQEEIIPPEQEDEKPEEQHEEDEKSEKEKSEEEEVKKPVNLDLEIIDISEISTEDEQIQVLVSVNLKNIDERSAQISSLKDSLEFVTKSPDGKITRYVSQDITHLPHIQINPGEVESATVDIYDESFETDVIYETKAVYTCEDIEEVSAQCEFKIETPFDHYSFLSETIDNLASNMYNQLTSDENIYGVKYRGDCFSPLGIALGLTDLLIAAGEDSETSDEILSVLGDEDAETLLNSMKILYEDVLYYEDSGCKFNIGDKIWICDSLEDDIKQNYLDSLKDNNCETEFLDFSSKNARQSSASTINEWFLDNTNDLIDGFEINRARRGRVRQTNDGSMDFDLPENRIFPYMGNTIHFSGSWKTPFKPEDTKNEEFYLPVGSGSRGPSGDSVTVPFMNYVGPSEDIKIVDEVNFKAIELPYEDNKFNMRIIVPKEGYDFSDISLDAENLENLRESLSKSRYTDTDFDIHIPKIGFNHIRYERTQYDLKEQLKNMGMLDVFSSNADFSNMIDPDEIQIMRENGLYFNLSGFGHSADIIIDELGSETAAAKNLLGVSISSNGKREERGIQPDRRERIIDNNNKNKDEDTTEDLVVFKANRPFYFEITYEIAENKELKLINGDISSYIITPLVLDLEGDGIKTCGLYDGVLFDLDNDGKKDLTGWTAGSDDSFLALDLDGNGCIDDGGELFGDNTLLSNGKKASNGFEALSQYDSNLDGKIDRFDHVWSDLLLWNDINHNGISEETELKPVKASRIKEIFLEYDYLNKLDNGNLLRECSTFKNKDGSTGDIIDIWFRTIIG